MNNVYNGKFNGNILLVGRTGCGKTTFLEKLAINNFFGEIVKTEWISGIEIDSSRKAQIQSCFSNETEVYVATEKDDLDLLIEKFKQVKQDNDNVNISNSFGELKKMDRLIVLDDVSGVADLLKNFANFLTVSRKFGYNVVYVFHVIIPSNQIWQKIISQTNIFNIFPASVPFNSVSKILQANCISQSKGYIPVRLLWLTRLFTELANSHEKHCLTIDCSYTNVNGPGRFRTQAENPEKQVCYFGKPNEDKFYNRFLSWRIKSENYENEIYFQIEKIRSADGSETFSAKKHWKMAQAQLNAVVFTLESNTDQEQNSFQTLTMNDNDVHFKKERKTRNTQYSLTKVKARNILTNVGYRRFKESDFTNVSFIIDILSFLLHNFNPINIERKVDTENEQKMISFLWEVCVPVSLTTYIFIPENYQIIADPKLTYQKANKVV